MRDRYNAANTMKMAENVFINAGTVLYGEYATELMRVTASSSPPITTRSADAAALR